MDEKRIADNLIVRLTFDLGYPECDALIAELDPILRIITKIIQSSKNAGSNKHVCLLAH